MLDIHADLVLRDGRCFRLYYMRKTEKVLVYHGEHLDNLSFKEEIENVEREYFVTFAETFQAERW